MKSESGSDYEASCAPSDKRASKSTSTSRKPRAPRPKLMKWSDADWRQAVLAIVYACGEKGVQIPFDAAAKTVNPNCTGGALQQAILKLRGKQVAEGHKVPILKMAWSKSDGTASASSEKATSKVGNSLSEPAKVVYRKTPRRPTADAFTKAHIVKIKTNSIKHVKGREVGATPNANVLIKQEEPGLSSDTPSTPIEHGPSTSLFYAPVDGMATPPYTLGHASDPQEAKRSLSDVEDDSDEEVCKDTHKKSKTTHNGDFDFDPFSPNTFDRAYTAGGRPYDPFEFGTESFHEAFRVRDGIIEEHNNDNDTDQPMTDNDDHRVANNYDNYMANSYGQPMTNNDDHRVANNYDNYMANSYDQPVIRGFGQPMFNSYGQPMGTSYMGEAYYLNGPPVPTVEHPGAYTTGVRRRVNRHTGTLSLDRNNGNREQGAIDNNGREMEVDRVIMPHRPNRTSYNNGNRYDLGCFNNGGNGIHDTSLPAVDLFAVITDPVTVDPDATRDWVHIPAASRSLPYIPRSPFRGN